MKLIGVRVKLIALALFLSLIEVPQAAVPFLGLSCPLRLAGVMMECPMWCLSFHLILISPHLGVWTVVLRQKKPLHHMSDLMGHSSSCL